MSDKAGELVVLAAYRSGVDGESVEASILLMSMLDRSLLELLPCKRCINLLKRDSLLADAEEPPDEPPPLEANESVEADADGWTGVRVEAILNGLLPVLQFQCCYAWCIVCRCCCKL
jgi:hypothetical protein